MFIVFYESLLYAEKVEEGTKVIIFNSKKITEKKDEPGKLEVIDYGEPLDEAPADLDDVIDCFNYYAKLAEGLDAKQNAPVSLPMETFKSYVHKEPIGVVALITPCFCADLLGKKIAKEDDFIRWTSPILDIIPVYQANIMDYLFTCS
ncbi:hypothetical protein JHK82_031074 [Glycine max]|nr:hypothetical protein JHK87_030986 [Glycine soja]KAG4988738.1 hypothetical protein JHK85_031721 [Glycine max]KAG4994343.1 hypothetical protein JHK86_031170 [Glycine max]KAG5124337.1 hypothetical protein JHK82_031074 [Glycine max]KAG5145756.1 hypothetical protein JHK84_031299 [Glycine max]